MEFRNCKRCGKVYQSANPDFCPDCVDAGEKDFRKVRDFIKDNPKVSLEVVAEATGVDEDQILEFLRDGRLEPANLPGPVLECKRCGKPIYQGEYCVLCLNEISQNFKSTSQQQSKKKSHGEQKTKSFARRYRERR